MSLTRVYQKLKTRYGESDEDSPLEFKYVARLRFLLSTLASWPHAQFGKRRIAVLLSTYAIVIIVIAIVSFVLGGTYLWCYRHKLTFFDMGHIALTMLLDVLYLERVLVGQTDKYREAIRDWLLEFHLIYFKTRSQYSAQICSQVNVISALMTIYAQYLMWCGNFLFSFQPLYNNYRNGMFGDHRPVNGTFEQAVYYYSPYEGVYTTVNGFWMLFMFNIYNSYNVSCGLVIFDLLLSLIVLQIWGHLKILIQNLSSFPTPARDGVYSTEENIQIRLLLKENIDHHRIIIKFVDKCSNAFSEYLFSLYFFIQIISCILLIEVSALTPEALAKYGPLTIGIHQQLIVVSILFEILNTKSEKLMDAVYEVPWQCMDSSNRRTVQFLLHRVQTPLSLKAGKVVPVGVQTMLAVLKTTFSYYMMLSTVAKEK